VDSSATAALLLEQGYDVVGITLKLWPQDCVSRAEDKCCGPQAVTDARAVCHTLGVPYYLIDEAEQFQSKVIQYFADEYKAGRTPNPCVMCNQNLKFGRLIDRADQLGAQYIATGHFARVERADLNNEGTKEQSANLVTLLLRCLNLIWSELIVPSRRIWAGLAAIWILIIAANISFRQQSPAISKNSPAGGMMAFREQQKLLNDLFADRSGSFDADKPKVFSPKPRTELAQTDIV